MAAWMLVKEIWINEVGDVWRLLGSKKGWLEVGRMGTGEGHEEGCLKK